MCIFTTASGTKILATKVQGDLDFGALHVEAYHLAELMGYSQQHSIRKQVLSDWVDLFEEDVDYVMVHDEQRLRAYELRYGKKVGHIKPMKLERGRMFLSPSGLAKVFEHSSKDSHELQSALADVLETSRADELDPSSPEELRGAGTDVQLEALERQRQYEILEQLIDHLKHVKEPGLRRLALMSAELGLGRELHDIRALLEGERPTTASPKPTPAPAPPPHVSSRDVMPKPTPASNQPVTVVDRDQAAKEYLAKRPLTGGALFDDIPNVYYGLKQIGEKAGGYSAVQAGKAADIVAAHMGYSREDIRQKQLPFNELPELPDNTSGKLRKMYRFNASFANHVIVTLRVSQQFVPGRPQDLGPFGQGGEDLPKLSRGPFDE